MTKDQMEKFLQKSLDLDDAKLKEVLITYIVERGFKPDHQGWEQLRFVKQEVDALWQALKKCSERRIVKEKVEQLVAAFPKPTELKKKR